MNIEMAYLLGLIHGNGEIVRGNNNTTIVIEIPHKKLITEQSMDVHVYIKASIADIKTVLEPLIGTIVSFIQEKQKTIFSFTKANDDYLIREIIDYVGLKRFHENMRINENVFNFSYDHKIFFLKGFADVTGYIRRSNYFMKKWEHRVYLEIPRNWFLVVDICNLLRSIDIPVQNINWAHPNMRDGSLKKYNEGDATFWKKEHQIKIWANEFLPIGFAIIHKRETLNILSDELINNSKKLNTHKFYWEKRKKLNNRPSHPEESNEFIPNEIRGIHYESWTDIAYDLGYHE